MILLPVLALAVLGWAMLAKIRADATDTLQADARELVEDLVSSSPPRLFGWGGDRHEVGHAVSISPEGGVWVGYDTKIPTYVDPPRPPVDPSPSAGELARLLDDTERPRAEIALAAAGLTSGRTASGLPVRPFALRLALRAGSEGGVGEEELRSWAERLCEAVLGAPSSYDRVLLDEAFAHLPNERVLHWRERWDEWRPFREFYADHHVDIADMMRQSDAGDTDSGHLRVSRALWSEGGELEAIGTLTRGVNDDFELYILPAADVERVLGQKFGKRVPPYLGVRIWMDGELVFGLRADENTTRWAPEKRLARLADDRSPIVGEIVYADSALFEEAVDRIARPVTWLIGLAASAALVGWFAAWRAFRKQRRLSRMKDNFVSAVSHELKAPVAAIGLMAEEMAEGRDDRGKRGDYARLIAGECARLGSLVENVLDHARFEQGRESFEFEEADLGELARATADLMRPAAAKRGSEIAVEAPPAGELCADADARALGRALVNLIDNAIKYAPAGKAITLRAARSRGRARFEVEDGGEPLRPSERERVFERFHRGGSELTRETQGVGLGLSLVRRIAEAHDGRAFAGTAAGGGNRFVIEIDAKP